MLGAGSWEQEGGRTGRSIHLCAAASCCRGGTDAVGVGPRHACAGSETEDRLGRRLRPRRRVDGRPLRGLRTRADHRRRPAPADPTGARPGALPGPGQDGSGRGRPRRHDLWDGHGRRPERPGRRHPGRDGCDGADRTAVGADLAPAVRPPGPLPGPAHHPTGRRVPWHRQLGARRGPGPRRHLGDPPAGAPAGVAPDHGGVRDRYRHTRARARPPRHRRVPLPRRHDPTGRDRRAERGGDRAGRGTARQPGARLRGRRVRRRCPRRPGDRPALGSRARPLPRPHCRGARPGPCHPGRRGHRRHHRSRPAVRQPAHPRPHPRGALRRAHLVHARHRRQPDLGPSARSVPGHVRRTGRPVQLASSRQAHLRPDRGQRGDRHHRTDPGGRGDRHPRDVGSGRHVPPGARRQGRSPVPAPQAAHHGARRRGTARRPQGAQRGVGTHVQDGRRPSGDPGRSIPAGHVHRRAPPAVQRPEGPDEPGRPTAGPAVRSRAVGRDPVGAPAGAAGDHRHVAGERPLHDVARDLRPPRPLLRRQLVAGDRPADPGPHRRRRPAPQGRRQNDIRASSAVRHRSRRPGTRRTARPPRIGPPRSPRCHRRRAAPG